MIKRLCCSTKAFQDSPQPGDYFYSFSWAADQVIGDHDVFPRYGDIAGAWAQDMNGVSWPYEYIEVYEEID